MADAKYISQGIATRAFGVTFRSKLEATWAYHFTEKKHTWEYADSPWHDFTIKGCHIEIKPLGLDFLIDAVARAWPYRSEWVDRTMAIFLGEPDCESSCIVQIMECNNCAMLSIKIRNDYSRYAWHPDTGVYGGWCEHGTFTLEDGIDPETMHRLHRKD